MGHPSTIDERAALLAANLKGWFDKNIVGGGVSLEMILSANGSDLTADFFMYDWTKRKRKEPNPTIHYTQFNLTGSETSPIKSAYLVMRRALLENGFFIEEKDETGLLIQPFVADVSSISLLVNDFIAKLRSEKNPALEPPKLNGSEQSYRDWLLKYHKINGIPLIRGVPAPKYLDTQDKEQLEGMFYGINKPTLLEQRLRERQFVIEFYKAQGAMLPENFDKWGHKQVEFFYQKLNMRYVRDNPQGSLFIE